MGGCHTWDCDCRLCREERTLKEADEIRARRSRKDWICSQCGEWHSDHESQKDR